MGCRRSLPISDHGGVHRPLSVFRSAAVLPSPSLTTREGPRRISCGSPSFRCFETGATVDTTCHRQGSRDGSGSLTAPITLITDAETGQSSLRSFAPTGIGLFSSLVSKLQKLGKMLFQNPAAAAHEYRVKLSASDRCVHPPMYGANMDAKFFCNLSGR